MARAIVLHKSRNWDSPADVIRAEHRLTQLSNRERRKKKYNKQNEEFWNSGKKELMSKTKRPCVSSQQLQETESTPLNSNDSCSDLPQQLIHKILAGIRTTVRESIQPQKGNLVLLLKRLKRTKNRKRIRT